MDWSGQDRRHLGLDPQGGRVHVGHRAAVFAEESVAEPVQDVHDDLFVHGAPASLAGQARQSAGAAAGGRAHGVADQDELHLVSPRA